MEWIESLLEKYGRLKLAQEAKDLDDARKVLATDREVVRAHHRRTLGEQFRQEGDDDGMIHIGDRHEHVHVTETHPANGRTGLLSGPLAKLALAAGLAASGAGAGAGAVLLLDALRPSARQTPSPVVDQPASDRDTHFELRLGPPEAPTVPE
ncbi:MAG TPA: hypothetical protein VML55_11115 [Planctomycetaceae bacterium]|nr:hypothetical protein [Planctomycetaceae bacterium]